MKNTRGFFRCVALGLLAVFFGGCEHKEFCLDHSHAMLFDVVFDWELAPGAEPESMSLYMFPDGGGRPVRHEMPGNAGGTIRVQAGGYGALCFNGDTESIRCLHTETLEGFEITTRQASLLQGFSLPGFNATPPRAEGTEGERVASEPDMLWSGRAESLMLDKASDRRTAVFFPEPSVRTYTVEIRNAENLEHVSGMSASVSTMAGGILPGRGPGVLTEEKVTIPFEVSFSPDGNSISGRFRSFGHCPSEHNSHKLMVYALLEDGSKWYYVYDITSIFHEAAGAGGTHIVLEGLPVPQPVGGDGFDPSVDEWQQIDVDIEM